MNVRPAAASILLILLMSCADAPADPGTGSRIDHSTDGDAVLLRVAFE
jgi:hypothetical protein